MFFCFGSWKKQFAVRQLSCCLSSVVLQTIDLMAPKKNPAFKNLSTSWEKLDAESATNADANSGATNADASSGTTNADASSGTTNAADASSGATILYYNLAILYYDILDCTVLYYTIL